MSAECIVKEHRRWTRWVAGRRTIGEGSLVLTNRRLIFLHRMASSPGLTATIRRLAGAPMETVLNEALALDKRNFQVPLSRIVKASIGSFIGFPLPRFYLSVDYSYDKKKMRRVAFRFRRPWLELVFHPQLFSVWGWVKAINRAASSRE